MGLRSIFKFRQTPLFGFFFIIFFKPALQAEPSSLCPLKLIETWSQLAASQTGELLPFHPLYSDDATPKERYSNVRVQNAELVAAVRKIASAGSAVVSKQMLFEIFWKLHQNHYFELPLTETGALVASGVSVERGGGMGHATWGRDLVRAIKGARSLYGLASSMIQEIRINRLRLPQGVSAKEVLSSLEKLRDEMQFKSRAMLKHMLSAMSTDQQIARLAAHVQDSSLHLREGAMSMPRVRWDPSSLSDVVRKNTQTGQNEVWPWNHMQFDYYYSSLRSLMNAFREGWLLPSELSDGEQAYVLLMMAMPISMQFWKVHTSDAWEEGNALRTSTIIMGSALYHYFLEGKLANPHSQDFSEAVELFLNRASENAFLPKHLRDRLSKLLKPSQVAQAITKARQTFHAQMSEGEAPHQYEVSDPLGKRGPDAALLHALWYDLLTNAHQGGNYLSTPEIFQLLSHVKRLERELGTIRYENDVYLAPFHWLNSGAEIPAAFTRNQRAVSASAVHEAFWTKNYSKLLEIFGPGFEAAWTIHDPMRASISGDLAISAGQASIYLDDYRYYFSRFLGQISGTRTGPQSTLLAADGSPNNAWQSPEAWIPYRRFDGAEPSCIYLACPHSPLYWTVAEGARAFEVGWQLATLFGE